MGRLELFKEDLNKIGHMKFQSKGFLCILTSQQTSGIDEILTRNILLLFGTKYKITKVDDFIWESGVSDVAISTNLPFSVYEKLTKDEYSNDL